jgi:hypothetical protein
MPRRSNRAEIEYAQLRKFFEFYVARYVDAGGLPPEGHPVARLELLEKKNASTARVGLDQAINDCIEMSMGFEPAEVRKVDVELDALGIVTLSEVRRRYAKHFTKIKARGSIKNETEYHLVRNILLDRTEKTAQEQSLLTKMIDDYESSQVRRPLT